MASETEHPGKEVEPKVIEAQPLIDAAEKAAAKRKQLPPDHDSTVRPEAPAHDQDILSEMAKSKHRVDIGKGRFIELKRTHGDLVPDKEGDGGPTVHTTASRAFDRKLAQDGPEREHAFEAVHAAEERDANDPVKLAIDKRLDQVLTDLPNAMHDRRNHGLKGHDDHRRDGHKKANTVGHKPPKPKRDRDRAPGA